ncbi:MFS transporter [Virgibacillus halodenitrificans]|uniref:MFS transporter n=1 Tax=Virgibacillus halodenitrificans TaxID=1482 RepID=UPI002DB935DF|nr:MFS transporter [Virgibacillus halodenitrificans]MEC2160133.1 MFS transporter [Virgibacillus halodenitrificans]
MNKFHQLHRTIKIRLLLQFAINVTTMTILPFIAIYFSNLVGAAITGVLVILVLLSGIAGGLLGGYWSDKMGRKKLMVMAECGIGFTFLLIATVNSSWAVMPYISFLLFMVNMFCNGIYVPVSSSMIYDIVETKERTFVFTVLYWASNLATAIGSITGAFLFERYHFYLFIVVGMISIISAIITYLFIAETYYPKKVNTSSVSIYANYKVVFKDKLYVIFLIASLCVFSLEAHLTNYIAIYLESNVLTQQLFGLLYVDGIRMIGILQVENTLMVVFAVGIVAWLANKKSDNSRLLGGMLLYVISYSLLSYTTIPMLLIICMLFVSIGELMFIPVRQSVLSEMTKETNRSSYLALDSFSGQGTMIIGGAAVTLGAVLPSYIMSVLFFLIGITSVLLMKIVVNNKEAHASGKSKTLV